MLREVQILARLALLAHATTRTTLHRTHERYHLLTVLPALHLSHHQFIL
jgi:hypothetical protein